MYTPGLPVEVEIRRAAKDDLPSLLRLQTASPEAAQWSSGSLREALSGCIVAEADRSVVGFLLYRDLPDEEREILNVVVDPRRRRQGIASRLLTACLFDLGGAAHLEQADGPLDPAANAPELAPTS